MNDWLNNNAGSSDFPERPSVTFDNVSDIVVGKIVDLPRQVDTQYGERLVVDIATVEGVSCNVSDAGTRRPAVVGEEVMVWVKPGQQARALRDALATAGAPGLEVGGTLALRYEKNGEQKKPGFNPPKLFVAQYEAPVAAVAVSESLI